MMRAGLVSLPTQRALCFVPEAQEHGPIEGQRATAITSATRTPSTRAPGALCTCWRNAQRSAGYNLRSFFAMAASRDIGHPFL